MADFRSIADAVKAGRRAKVTQLVNEALNEGATAEEILNQGLVVGMGEIGELFKANEVYVPEVLVAARAMYAGLDIVRPILVSTGAKPAGIVAIGTVEGDLHDIGKNLVGMMLEGAGFKVIDLGTDVSAEKFVDAVQNQGAQLVGLSALLTTTMPCMKKTVELFKSLNLNAKVMIGGAPVTQAYADEIGADGYSDDAASAVDLAKKLIAAL